MMLILLLTSCVASSVYLGCCGQTIINLVNGVYSTSVECDGLYLSSASTFTAIETLTLSLYFTSRISVFVNYQITVDSTAQFWTKLQITHDDDGLTNAGSIVRYHTQRYKTATGYYMDNLEPGHYTFKVYYKSTSAISMSSGIDYQAAILQVMWFTDVHAVSDGVKCYPSPNIINTYNVLSPIKDLKVNLLVPRIKIIYEDLLLPSRVVIAGYQLPIYSASSRWFMARLHKNNEQLTSTIMAQGDSDPYFSVNSLWMEYQSNAEYEFGVTYQNSYSSYFEDCQENYQGNKNLYAMYLPSNCGMLANIRPTSFLSLSTTDWETTDLVFGVTLSQASHIFVRYQYSAYTSTTYVVTRLVIDSDVMKHASSITGNDIYHGNSGMWQGVLTSGEHAIVVEHRSGRTYTHCVGSDYPFQTRAMDVLGCY